MRWDSHGDYFEQNWHYDLLFLGLQQLMDALQTRTNIHGVPLIEETTVIVCSEMSRHPALKQNGRKTPLVGWHSDDHQRWTRWKNHRWLQNQVLGKRLDLDTGDITDKGIKLKPEHLGATLLAMADLDPFDFGKASPILGAL